MDVRRVTIKDVAMAIGVTPQTVSRVLRRNGSVSSDTRIRVLDAVDRLKYVPNSAAVRLRTGGIKSVAVVFDSLINVYFSIMVDYLQKELSANGYEIHTVFVNSHTVTEEVYRSALSYGAVAVISFLEPEETLANTVRDYDVPLLVVGRRTEIDEVDYITTDDVSGGRLAAQRLIESGCKSFGYLGTAFGLTCVKDRYSGFENKLRECGYAASILDCDSGVRLAIEHYIQNNKKLPDGVLCFSDMLAYETLNVIDAMGLPPVKIIGYDNIQADIAMPIDLTTIGVQKPQFVKSVVALLSDKIEGRSTDRIAKKIAVQLHGGKTA